MEYQDNRLNPPLLLAEGIYQGYNYYVLSMGTHPCGYVEIPKDSPYFNVDYDCIPVCCHGGLTYGRGFLHTIADIEEDRYFIGWDYGHYMDYIGYFTSDENARFNNSKWTTKEIIYECMNVIEQLHKLEKEHTAE